MNSTIILKFDLIVNYIGLQSYYINMSVNKFQELKIGDKYSFNVDNPDILKRLSVDVYEDDLSGYRELITNGTTAVREAIEEEYITDDEGVVKVEINADENKMIIEDNGVGITKKRLEDVVTKIGKSTSRNSIDDTGQYGMGFLAAFKLTGFDGGFKMITKSRETGEAYRGIWTNEGFSMIEEDIDVSYGTRFEISLKRDIELKKRAHSGVFYVNGLIMDKLKKITKYPRVNTTLSINSVHYNYNEEWCSINDIIGSDEYIHIDKRFFELIMSTHKTDEYGEKAVVCLDSYVNARNVNVPDIGGNSFLRLKQEESVVVNNPNKGEVKTEEEAYDYDILTPKPTGTRDLLRNTSYEFNDWLKEQVTEYVDENYIKSNDKEKMDLGCRYMIRNGVKPENRVTETCVQEIIVEEQNDLKILDEFDIQEYDFIESDNATIKGDVYMCKSPTDRKVYSILNEGNTVIKYTGTSKASKIYRKYCELFDWDKVTSHVMSDNIDMHTLYKDRFESFEISYDFLSDKNIDIVYCPVRPDRLSSTDYDIVTTADDDLIELDNCVKIEEFAKEKLPEGILEFDKVYIGSEEAFNVIDTTEESTYVTDISKEQEIIIECLEFIDIRKLKPESVYNILVQDVDHDEAKELLEYVIVKDMSMDEVIRLGKILKNNL